MHEVQVIVTKKRFETGDSLNVHRDLFGNIGITIKQGFFGFSEHHPIPIQ